MFFYYGETFADADVPVLHVTILRGPGAEEDQWKNN